MNFILHPNGNAVRSQRWPYFGKVSTFPSKLRSRRRLRLNLRTFISRRFCNHICRILQSRIPDCCTLNLDWPGKLVSNLKDDLFLGTLTPNSLTLIKFCFDWFFQLRLSCPMLLIYSLPFFQCTNLRYYLHNSWDKAYAGLTEVSLHQRDGLSWAGWLCDPAMIALVHASDRCGH